MPRMSDAHEPEVLTSEEPTEESALLKPFLEHLEDLRWMLIKCLAALATAMAISFSFAPQLLRIIKLPLQRLPEYSQVHFLTPFEVTGAFTLAMKLAFYAGIVIASPFLLYFIADFVLPALTPREKRLVRPVVLGGSGLFLAGVALAYFVVIPAGLRFFIHYNQYLLAERPTWPINFYIAFVTHMMLAFGLCFELPLVILVLAKLGIVTHEFLRQKRPYVIVIIFTVAAIITPTTDPVNQSLLAVPMCVLYEACIWIAWLMERRKARSQS
jgi:sec-independent protein translocase protein TatC